MFSLFNKRMKESLGSVLGGQRLDGKTTAALAGLSKVFADGKLPLVSASALTAGLLGGKSTRPSAAKIGALVTKMAYIHALEEAVAKAKTPGGNVRSQMEELQRKLRSISANSGDTGGDATEDMQKAMKDMQKINQNLHDMMQRLQEASSKAIKGIQK